MTTENRLITPPPDSYFLAIRDEYLAIAGSGCGAALLDYIERMTLWKQAAGHTDAEWVYAPTRDLPAKLRHLWGESTIKRELRTLLAKGLLSTRPRSSASAAAAYRFEPAAVQAAVNAWAARDKNTPWDENNPPVRQKHPTGEVKITHGRDENNPPVRQKHPTGEMNLTHPWDESDQRNPLDSYKESLLESESLGSSSSSLLDAARGREGQGDDEDDTQSPDHPIGDFSQPQKTVYAEYADNIEPLTPLLRDHLLDAVREYGEEAVRTAIRAAVTHNVRRWAYVAKVLQNERGASVDASKWTAGEYGRFVNT